jgi:YVTN family beta-propeller protein
MGGVVGENKYAPLLFRHAINDKHELNIQVPVGQAPWGLAVSHDEAYLYVSSNGDHTINVVDRNTFKVLNTVKVNKDPNGIAFRP